MKNKSADSPKDSITLSHSSANLMRGCETRYYHYKVAGTDKDLDYEDNQDALMIGKAVHFIVEQLVHVYDSQETFDHWCDLAIRQHEVQEHASQIKAMAFKLLKLQKREGLHAVACEIEIKNDYMIGYVDIIVADEEKNWWIADVKTAARIQPLTVAKLANDYQLNLYAAHYKQIAKDLELDPKKFKGCRYRVVTKSKAKQRLGESLLEYIQRTDNTIQAHEYIIPIEKMDPTAILKQHKTLHKRALKLFNGTKPTKDYSHCSSFFRPCPYWSKCHGTIYTDSINEFEVRTY